LQPRKFVVRLMVAPEIVTAAGVVLSQFAFPCAAGRRIVRPWM
jgi:hypothetical protein